MSLTTEKLEIEALPVPLTQAEILEFGQRSARAVREAVNLRAEAKGVAADYKAQIKAKEEEIAELCDCINNGREYRPIAIRSEYDRPRCQVVTIRTDTGEVIRSRPMTPKETQTSLDDLI